LRSLIANSDTIHTDKWTKIGVNVEICLGSDQPVTQVHHRWKYHKKIYGV